MDKAKEIEQNKNTWTTNNQVVYNLFLFYCTPEMETKLQGMEPWYKINTKQDGLGLIAIIYDATHRCYETEEAMLDIFRADKS